MIKESVRSLILDTEAVSVLARRQGRDTVIRLRAALDLDTIVFFPTIVLAEILTGGQADAAVWRIVNKLTPVGLTTQISAHAGSLRERAEKVRRKKRDLTVDAVVAATAIARAPSLLITGDVEDLRLLTDGSDAKVVPVSMEKR